MSNARRTRINGVEEKNGHDGKTGTPHARPRGDQSAHCALQSDAGKIPARARGVFSTYLAKHSPGETATVLVLTRKVIAAGKEALQGFRGSRLPFQNYLAHCLQQLPSTKQPGAELRALSRLSVVAIVVVPIIVRPAAIVGVAGAVIISRSVIAVVARPIIIGMACGDRAGR